MSCEPEWVVGAYVDGGLDEVAVRRVEAHLVGCERCRRSVLALREEAAVLSEALHGRGAPVADAELEAPARGVVMGLPLSIGVTILGASGVTWLLETRLPVFDWLHPARLMGVSDMFWNLFSLLREESQGLLELAVALGVVASIAAVGSFLVGALSRRVSGGAAAGLLAAFLLAPAADAAIDMRVEERHVVVAEGEVVEATLVAEGKTVRIEGTVNGDVVAFGERVEVSGTIEGSLLVAGEEVVVSGEVRGNLFGGGKDLRIDGTAARSVAVGAERFVFGPDARVGTDLTAGGNQIEIAGEVGRDLTVGAEDLLVSGRVGRDVTLALEDVTFAAGAHIAGDVSVHTPEADGIVVDEGATLLGTLTPHEVEDARRSRFEHLSTVHFWLWRIVWLVGAFGVGLVLYLVVPALFAGRVESGAEFGKAVAIGLFSFPALAVVCFVLAITAIGIPLAVLLGVLYLGALYVAFLTVSALLGRHMTRPRSDSVREFGLALLAGLVVVTVLIHLPYVGFAARLVLLWLGLGLLALRGWAAWEARRADLAA